MSFSNHSQIRVFRESHLYNTNIQYQITRSPLQKWYNFVFDNWTSLNRVTTQLSSTEQVKIECIMKELKKS